MVFIGGELLGSGRVREGMEVGFGIGVGHSGWGFMERFGLEV